MPSVNPATAFSTRRLRTPRLGPRSRSAAPHCKPAKCARQHWTGSGWDSRPAAHQPPSPFESAALLQGRRADWLSRPAAARGPSLVTRAPFLWLGLRTSARTPVALCATLDTLRPSMRTMHTYARCVRARTPDWFGHGLPRRRLRRTRQQPDSPTAQQPNSPAAHRPMIPPYSLPPPSRPLPHYSKVHDPYSEMLADACVLRPLPPWTRPRRGDGESPPSPPSPRRPGLAPSSWSCWSCWSCSAVPYCQQTAWDELAAGHSRKSALASTLARWHAGTLAARTSASAARGRLRGMAQVECPARPPCRRAAMPPCRHLRRLLSACMQSCFDNRAPAGIHDVEASTPRYHES